MALLNMSEISEWPMYISLSFINRKLFIYETYMYMNMKYSCDLCELFFLRQLSSQVFGTCFNHMEYIRF